MNTIRIIEAGAGSGKTYKITEELFNAIKNKKCRPEGFVLTTFTKKAAAELQDRLVEKLSAAGMAAEAAMIRGALIGTVNSICGRIVNEFAMEQGMTLRPRVLPESAEALLFNRALSEVIDENTLRRIETLDRQFGNGTGYKKAWRDTVCAIVKDARANDIASELLESQAKEMSVLIDRIAGCNPGNLDDLREAAKQAVLNIKKLGDTTGVTTNAIDELELFERSAGSREWQVIQKLGSLAAGKKTGADDLLNNVRLLATSHIGWESFRADMAEYVAIVFGFAARAMNAYARHKKELGIVDFADQEKLCLDLLRKKDKSIIERLSNRMDMVFIDEFQDTSPVQLAIFLEFTKIARESVWVGDPKQAIYGFRGTDPQLMLTAIRQIVEKSDLKQQERLKKSYRSECRLVEFVNTVFTPAFKLQGLDEKSVPLLCDEKRPALPAIPLESWVIDGKNKNALFAGIAAGIRNILNEHDNPRIVFDKKSKQARTICSSDIGVLCRTRNDCQGVTSALRSLGIVCQYASPGLFKEPLIRLVIASLRLMVNSKDSLAMAEVTWTTDVLCKNNSPDEWLGSRILSLDSWKTHSVISEILEKTKTNPPLTPTDALRKAMTVSGAWQMSCRISPAGVGAAWLDRLEAIGTEYEESARQSGEGITIRGFLDYLDKTAENELDTYPLAAVDAVTVGTWHSSKGLEWHMVVAVDPAQEKDPSFFSLRQCGPENCDIENPLAGRRLHFLPNPYHPQSLPGSQLNKNAGDTEEFKAIEAEEQRERTRILYVLFTRARDYLVFAARKKKTDFLVIHAGDTEICKVPQNGTVPGWVIKTIIPDNNPLTIEKTVDWFPCESPSAQRNPMVLSPSLITANPEVAFTVSDPVSFARRISLLGNPDMQNVGKAIHSFFAVDSSSLSSEQKLSMAVEILSGYDLSGAIAPADVLKTAEGFNEFISTKWRGADVLREIPITHFIENQVIDGITDCIIDMPESFVIIDYKTFPGNREKMKEEAGTYAPQLLAYADAVATATKKTCAGMWIAFVVSGEMVEVKR